MDLGPYADNIRHELAVAADAGGDDARALAERLVAPLDAAIRLTLQDVLAAAAEEITCELAPGSVELRLRGRDPEFVVTPPPAAMRTEDHPGAEYDLEPSSRLGAAGSLADADEAAMSRINLRMPDQLKARIEQAASGEGLSVNSWLVRAATAALERADRGPRRDAPARQGAQRFIGWAR